MDKEKKKHDLALIYAQEKLRIAIEKGDIKNNYQSEIDYLSDRYDEAYNYIG